MKEFHFVNERAHREYLDIPQHERDQFGVTLNAVAGDQGMLPEDEYYTGDGVTSKPLKSLGKGLSVIQLSINGSPAYRVVYCVKYANRLYVLHSWVKTTNGVDRPAMALVKARFKEMLEDLRNDGFKV